MIEFNQEFGNVLHIIKYHCSAVEVLSFEVYQSVKKIISPISYTKRLVLFSLCQILKKMLKQSAAGPKGEPFIFIGTFLFGLAFVREFGWVRWLGGSMIFIGILSLASFGRYYLGLGFLTPIVNWMYEWIYGYLQPAVRIGLGIWLLNSAMVKTV